MLPQKSSTPRRRAQSPQLRTALIFTVLTFAALSPPALRADEPQPTRPLRDLNKSYFPFTPVESRKEWKLRHEEIQRRVLVASGLWPMPEKTPLNTVIHGRIEQADYTVEKVIFESLPGHFVTGNLYLPKNIKGKIPAIISPHGHWPNGRFMHESDAGMKRELASDAEQFENAARSPLQARCVQLARMGCAVFFYDMLGYADSIQFPEHRHGPTANGFVSADAELNLVSYFGLQNWNSIRAVDFVSSLPFVDPKRIGCTGASGGGTQTMVAAGIDDRIAAAFPCVMVSTGMQGGCTCENAHYLRINQGNIDIAALTAPRPLGMTAADDWTKELETKGFPDLKNLYTMLRVPELVEAHFNITFPHNYNAVSRAQMYAFFNRHFKLGLYPLELAERDFPLLTRAELTVWNEQHPRPTGDQVGVAHEIAVINWFKQQSSRQIEPLLEAKSKADIRRARAVIGGALQVMIGRGLPKRGETAFTSRAEADKGDYVLRRGTVSHGTDVIETTFLHPTKWNRDVVLWLTLKGEASIIQPDGNLSEAAQRLVDRGFAIACPQPYLPGATRNPNVYGPPHRKPGGTYEGFSGYHYGYNPSLFAERVRDALAIIGQLRDDKDRRATRILVAGVEGAGIIAAATTALAQDAVHELVCDTEGFRFANLDDVWDVNFVPGAAKYGDVPAILSLCAPVKTTILSETQESAAGVTAAFVAAGSDKPLMFRFDGPPAEGAIFVITSWESFRFLMK